MTFCQSALLPTNIFVNSEKGTKLERKDKIEVKGKQTFMLRIGWFNQIVFLCLTKCQVDKMSS